MIKYTVRRYHSKGAKPKRPVIVNDKGRLYPEYGETIMLLYCEDKVSIAIMARIYGCTENAMGNYIRRHMSDWLGGEESEYRVRCRAYAGVLNALREDPDRSTDELADTYDISADAVRRIAKRNGIRRGRKCRQQ